MAVNGSYVSRAEMLAHLEPMKDDISEIKGDVKLLLAVRAEWEGRAAVVREERDWRRTVQLYWRPTLVATLISVAATLVGAHL